MQKKWGKIILPFETMSFKKHNRHFHVFGIEKNYKVANQMRFITKKEKKKRTQNNHVIRCQIGQYWKPNILC